MLAMTDTTTKEAPAPQSGEVKSVKCECCKLTEECTEEYISRVRERYQGRWICGLCIEAVKDEIGRSGRRISTEEALDRHSSFYEEFRSCTPTEELISTVKEVLLRSLDLSGRSQSYFPGLNT